MNLLIDLESIVPSRSLNLTYVILDTLFLLIFLGLLIYKKRYQTVIWSIFGGILYFIVDYGFFHLVGKTRIVTFNGRESETITALILLWMSLSYGITNFAFIWLALKKDQYLKEWLILIIGWWLVCPTLSKMNDNYIITTSRTTTSYHYIMALILVIGYLGITIFNLINKKEKRINILLLNIIGISVQFAWEISLLINGIRPLNGASIMTLLINSIIETNLGMPYIYLIFIFVNKYLNENLTKKDLSLIKD